MTDDELKELEKEKARLTLDNKKLTSERDAISRELSRLDKHLKKVILDIAKAELERDAVLTEVDNAKSEVRSCKASVSEQLKGLKDAKEKSDKSILDGEKQRDQIRKEEKAIEEKVLAFNEQIRTVSIDKTDYKKAEKEAMEERKQLEAERVKLSQAIKENEALKKFLDEQIAKTQAIEQSFKDHIKDLELKKTNYEDQKNRLAEEWAEIRKEKKAIEKLKRKIK